MTNSWVCIDASLLVKIVVEEPYSSQARALWRAWQQEGREIAAPPLLRYEVTSVMRKHVARGLRTVEESRGALDRALAFDVQYLEPPDFHQRSFDLSNRLDQSTTYDAHYLALAEYLACEFWTADKRLVRAVKDTLSWVKWLGDL